MPPRLTLVLLAALYLAFAWPLLRESHRRLQAQRKAQRHGPAYFRGEN